MITYCLDVGSCGRGAMFISCLRMKRWNSSPPSRVFARCWISASCLVIHSSMRSLILSFMLVIRYRIDGINFLQLTLRMISKYSWQEQLSRLSLSDSWMVRSRMGFIISCFLMILWEFGLFCLRSRRKTRKAAAS